MTWLTFLLVAAAIAAIAGLIGIKPRGARHIANTQLMGVARIVLVLIVVLVAYLMVRARQGG